MSKLQDLINELCPDGMKYVNIGSIVNYEQPTKYIVNNTNYDDNFLIPVLTAGQTFILGYTNEQVGVYDASKSNPVIIFDDFTGAFKWVDFQFKVKSSAMKILKANENIVLLRYVFYIMGFLNYSSDEHKRLWISTYSEFQIPVPSLEIQREIVRILDTFTALSDNLKREKELRIQQYEYYRDKLLTFDDGVEYKTLGETIVSLNTGLNPRRFFKLNTDNANNYYVTIRELQNNKIVFSEKTDRMNDAALKLCNNRSNLEAGDVLFSGTGTIGVTALIEKTPENWNIKEGVYAIKPKRDIINSKFLMYLLCSEDIRKAFLKKAAGGTVKSVPMAELKSVPIPVPPLEEQGRIVNILDKFTALIENIDKEIELRQKQYEYYRDKLLTFKELTT